MLKLKRGEKIKDIEGFEGLYQITTLERVWSIRRKKFMTYFKEKKGYMTVSLNKDGKQYYLRLHRLIAKAFIPNPENKPQINHLNGNKGDNRISNLEWCTARENIQHACNTGLNKVFKIHTDLKHIICRAYQTGEYTQKWLAEMFNISQPGICYIIRTYTPMVCPT
jgi:hypothetical protein